MKNIPIQKRGFTMIELIIVIIIISLLAAVALPRIDALLIKERAREYVKLTEQINKNLKTIYLQDKITGKNLLKPCEDFNMTSTSFKKALPKGTNVQSKSAGTREFWYNSHTPGTYDLTGKSKACAGDARKGVLLNYKLTNDCQIQAIYFPSIATLVTTKLTNASNCGGKKQTVENILNL